MIAHTPSTAGGVGRLGFSRLVQFLAVAMILIAAMSLYWFDPFDLSNIGFQEGGKFILLPRIAPDYSGLEIAEQVEVFASRQPVARIRYSELPSDQQKETAVLRPDETLRSNGPTLVRRAENELSLLGRNGFEVHLKIAIEATIVELDQECAPSDVGRGSGGRNGPSFAPSDEPKYCQYRDGENDSNDHHSDPSPIEFPFHPIKCTSGSGFGGGGTQRTKGGPSWAFRR